MGHRAWVLLVLLLAPLPDRAADRPLDAAERAGIERACERLLIAYALATDRNDAAGIYGAYADDGLLKSTRVSISGRDEIEAYFRKRVAERKRSGMGTRHVLTNILVTVRDRDHAHAVAYETMYRYDLRGPRTAASLQPALLATIDAELERTPQGWRFAKRETVDVTAAQ